MNDDYPWPDDPPPEPLWYFGLKWTAIIAVTLALQVLCLVSFIRIMLWLLEL